jgi:hypothetical protein
MLRTILERLVAFGVALCDANDLEPRCADVPRLRRARVAGAAAKDGREGEETVITASVVQDAARAGKTEIVVDAAALLTPLARDESKGTGIRFVRSGEK